MAKIKFSVGIAAASGKVGGNVFSRNGSGAYLKTFAMPVNPNSTKQQNVRASFGALAGAWRNLTVAQRAAWNDMAPQYPAQDRLGNTIQYSGQQLFVKLNQSLISAGKAQIDSPLIPKSFSNRSINSLSLEVTAGAITEAIVFMSDPGTSDESFIVTITPGLSAGITKPGKSQFRKVEVFGDASLTEDLDIATTYESLYGVPEVGATVFVRVELLNNLTGQRLNLGQSSTIVVAGV